MMYEIQMKGEILMHDETVIQTSFNDFNMALVLSLIQKTAGSI